MKDTQLSVYLVNKPGELARITSHLASFGINIKAISVADSSEYGVARITTSDANKAAAALKEMGYGFITTGVVAVELADSPGALSEICKKLADAGISIRYVYATVTPGGGVAMAIFNTDDNDRADKLITG